MRCGWNRNILYLADPQFALVRIESVFHCRYRFSFVKLPFLYQFCHALGIHNRSPRQTLKIAGLARVARPFAAVALAGCSAEGAST